ncbi:hypothetical protein GDO81_012928 [Engystomops pustulosus]|uniref:Uncharacterized protein n=1 Tax=Engystomops pustulosus TaxID=76066 RepID=A0AAV7B204_ENGPU|nr:hypothetical protein GDO81_012928 [Engystomops pustulosus]
MGKETLQSSHAEAELHCLWRQSMLGDGEQRGAVCYSRLQIHSINLLCREGRGATGGPQIHITPAGALTYICRKYLPALCIVYIYM